MGSSYCEPHAGPLTDAEAKVALSLHLWPDQTYTDFNPLFVSLSPNKIRRDSPRRSNRWYSFYHTGS